ncbi:MAG TPA: sulfotransferase domain-containing protein [Edaphocola sp.]|nr:sulfotransferase domain-containing protein [Edaphocola sp.]
MKPNFLCVGAQKAGTTTLHDILKQHPDIYLPKIKESHFFDRSDHYGNGIQWWLQEFFGDYAGEKIMGEITPEYLYYEEVPEKIYKDLGPDTKIIIILRNPMDRAYSHYLMSKRRNYEKMTFEEAILAERERIEMGAFERNHFSYIDRGLYAEQLKRYYSLFGKERIMLLIFEEDIKKDIKRTIQKIEVFLGVEQIPLNTNLESNVAREPINKEFNKFLRDKSLVKYVLGKLIFSKKVKYKIAKLLEELNMREIDVDKSTLSEVIKKELLINYFLDDINEIEKNIGIDLSMWKENL